LQQPGWSVELDGKRAELVPADHGLVAVAVPGGAHHVTLRYHAPGQVAGAALTGLAIVLLFGAGIVQRRRGQSAKSKPDVDVTGPRHAETSAREPVQQSEQ